MTTKIGTRSVRLTEDDMLLARCHLIEPGSRRAGASVALRLGPEESFVRASRFFRRQREHRLVPSSASRFPAAAILVHRASEPGSRLSLEIRNREIRHDESNGFAVRPNRAWVDARERVHERSAVSLSVSLVHAAHPAAARIRRFLLLFGNLADERLRGEEQRCDGRGVLER
jgi:hypothetical protein